MPKNTHNYRPEPYLSRFRTTLRNELHDWMGRTVMYSAYFIGIIRLLEGLKASIENLGISLPLLANTYSSKIFVIFFVTILSIPALLPFATASHWHMGFKSRIRPFFMSIALLIAYYLNEIIYPQSLISAVTIFWIVVFVFTIAFILKRLHSRQKHRPDFIAIALTIILTCLIYFGLSLYINWETISRKLTELELWTLPNISSTLLAGIIVVLISITPVLIVIEQIKKSKRLEKTIDRSKNYKSISSWAGTILGIVGILFLLFILSDSYLYQAIVTLIFLFLAGDPGLFFSRQRAHLRNLKGMLHLNFSSSQLSFDPYTTSQLHNPVYTFRRFLEQNTQNSVLFLILIIGGGIVPILAYYFDIERDLTTLVGIAITVSIGLSMIFISFWFVNIRRKHIVIPFIVMEDHQSSHLIALANLMTNTFVEQLRHIALLLSMRQIEVITSRNDATLPVFVTNGQEQELIDQVRSLGDIEIASKKVPFGGILAYIGNLLAHTKVSGTITPQKDNSVAVGIEFSQRGGQVIAIDMAFVSETSASDLEKPHLEKIAQALAVKLIIKLGNHYHLATSWESLLDFVNGLDAAYQRNWWQAVSSYRKAIAFEEASGGALGTAYYHLGAIKILQGEPNEGYGFLEIAETTGIPKAETQYMIALALFNIYRDNLHFDRACFDDIKHKCQVALSSRPNFPESHHLLATAFYQRGKLLERAYSSQPKLSDERYNLIDPPPQDFQDDYKKAAKHFNLAIKGYEKAIRSLRKDPIAELTDFDERIRLIQLRISATHRLGDSLRSLERFSEGDTYYKEALGILPTNIRTMVDRAKTFCHSENWQLADQFIRQDIFNHIENRDNKSACFYMGWSIAGGLADELTMSSKISDYFVRKFENLSKKRRTDQLSKQPTLTRGETSDENAFSKQERKRLLGKSMLFLDFAFHQYPRYLQAWKQTNWYDDFHQAVLLLGAKKEYNEGYRFKCYHSEFFISDKHYIDQLYLWLCWRVIYLLPENKYSNDHFAYHAIGWDPLLGIQLFPYKDFSLIFTTLCKYRDEVADLQEKSSRERVRGDIKLRIERARLYQKIFSLWDEGNKKIAELLENLERKNGLRRIQFCERWAIDIFAELSMITVRVLAEIGAYEDVEFVAQISLEKLNNWLNCWSNLMPETFFISSKVFDCQIASINGWLAYAKYKKTTEISTKYRLMQNRFKDCPNTNMEDIETIVQTAKKYMPNNPLAIYVDALIDMSHGYLEEAANILNGLLSQVSPFNPHTYDKRNNFNYDNGDLAFQNSINENINSKLYYVEHISGQLQFFEVMSTSQIHLQLGKIAKELGDFKTNISHLTRAYTDTPYYDERVDVLMEIIDAYKREGLFAYALSVLNEAGYQHRNLLPIRLPSTRFIQLLVLECVLKTSLEEYRDSLERGLEIATYWENTKLSSIQDQIITILGNLEFRNSFKFYQSKVLSRFKAIEGSMRKEGFIKNTKDLFELVKTIKKYTVQKILDVEKNTKSFEESNLNTFQSKCTSKLSYVLTSQILTELHQDIINFIIQQCEWMNNYAFNNIELGVGIEKAEEFAKTAIDIMMELEELFENPQDKSNWKRNLAQYTDTIGWIYFNKGSEKNLEIAIQYFKQALEYNQESALIYYHMARTKLAQLEHIWHSNPDIRNGLTSKNEFDVLVISSYLRNAFLYWRHAHRLDKTRSLYSRLRIVRKRIDTYRNNWEIVMSPTVKSENSAAKNQVDFDFVKTKNE